MKRDTYSIISSRFRVSKAHTWNSALREMVHVVKADLTLEESSAEIIDKELWKIGKQHIKGFYYWETNKGNIITVIIKKEE